MPQLEAALRQAEARAEAADASREALQQRAEASEARLGRFEAARVTVARQRNVHAADAEGGGGGRGGGGVAKDAPLQQLFASPTGGGLCQPWHRDKRCGGPLALQEHLI